MNNRTLVYAVFKEAAYRHECGGIFTDPGDAEAAAELLRDGEPDGHHHYIVVPFYLNEMTEQLPLNDRGGWTGGGGLVELPVHKELGTKERPAARA